MVLLLKKIIFTIFTMHHTHRKCFNGYQIYIPCNDIFFAASSFPQKSQHIKCWSLNRSSWEKSWYDLGNRIFWLHSSNKIDRRPVPVHEFEPNKTYTIKVWVIEFFYIMFFFHEFHAVFQSDVFFSDLYLLLTRLLFFISDSRRPLLNRMNSFALKTNSLWIIIVGIRFVLFVLCSWSIGFPKQILSKLFPSWKQLTGETELWR